MTFGDCAEYVLDILRAYIRRRRDENALTQPTSEAETTREHIRGYFPFGYCSRYDWSLRGSERLEVEGEG